MTELSLSERRTRLRLLYHLTVIVPPALVLAAGALASAEALAALAIVILGLHALSFRRLPVIGQLERSLITVQPCLACGFAIPLWNWWKCACGYTGFSVRHVLAPCRNCRREFSWVTCPRCEAQIPCSG